MGEHRRASEAEDSSSAAGGDTLDHYASQLIALATKMQQSSCASQPSTLFGNHTSAVPLVAIARTVLDMRRSRKQFMPASLFHEPAWEILLSLYIAQEDRRVLFVKNLVQDIEAPVTTSQRWIDQLAHMKLVDRSTDPDDRRRSEVSLSAQGRTMLEAYLRSLAGGMSAPCTR